MRNLREVRTVASFLGATVEDDVCGNTHECRVEAPHRKRWVDGGVHEMIANTYRPWKPDYADLLARMECGLEDCEGPCEWCDGV
jgi:hypothetical protein